MVSVLHVYALVFVFSPHSLVLFLIREQLVRKYRKRTFYFHFPWYDVSISYIVRFFHDRHTSKIGGHPTANARNAAAKSTTRRDIQSLLITYFFYYYFVSCLHTTFPTERPYLKKTKKNEDN